MTSSLLRKAPNKVQKERFRGRLGGEGNTNGKGCRRLFLLSQKRFLFSLCLISHLFILPGLLFFFLPWFFSVLVLFLVFYLSLFEVCGGSRSGCVLDLSFVLFSVPATL